MAAEETSELLQVMEVLLTAEVFNRNRDLDGNDLPPRCREAFGMGADGLVKRPVIVSDGTVAQATGIGDASERVKGNPFIELDSFGHRMHISALDAAAGWFLKKGGKALVRSGHLHAYPVLRDVPGSLVSQAEHTVIVTGDGCIVTTR